MVRCGIRYVSPSHLAAAFNEQNEAVVRMNCYMAVLGHAGVSAEKTWATGVITPSS